MKEQNDFTTKVRTGMRGILIDKTKVVVSLLILLGSQPRFRRTDNTPAIPISTLDHADHIAETLVLYQVNADTFHGEKEKPGLVALGDKLDLFIYGGAHWGYGLLNLRFRLLSTPETAKEHEQFVQYANNFLAAIGDLACGGGDLDAMLRQAMAEMVGQNSKTT